MLHGHGHLAMRDSSGQGLQNKTKQNKSTGSQSEIGRKAKLCAYFQFIFCCFLFLTTPPPPVALVVWYWLNPTPSTSQFPVGPVGVAAGETRAYASWYGVLWGFVVFVRAITSTGHTGGAQVPV